MTKNKRLTALTLSAGFALSLAVSPAAQAFTGNPFQMTSLPKGYLIAEATPKKEVAKTDEKGKDANCGATAKGKDGKCGEKGKDGKCGEKGKDGKCGEGKCGKAKDGKCGEGKCGKGKDGKCGETKPATKTDATKVEKDVKKEDKKGKEGKCGEGTCGGSN